MEPGQKHLILTRQQLDEFDKWRRGFEGRLSVLKTDTLIDSHRAALELIDELRDELELHNERMFE